MNSSGEKRVAASPGRFRPLRRRVAVGVMVCAVAVLAGRSSAQSVKYTDSQRKALILYNFAKFTEWPKSAFADDKAPFVIGVLGKDPFGKDIDIIKGKSIKGRALVVTYFSTADELTECHLLFISHRKSRTCPGYLSGWRTPASSPRLRLRGLLIGMASLTCYPSENPMALKPWSSRSTCSRLERPTSSSTPNC